MFSTYLIKFITPSGIKEKNLYLYLSIFSKSMDSLSLTNEFEYPFGISASLFAYLKINNKSIKWFFFTIHSYHRRSLWSGCHFPFICFHFTLETRTMYIGHVYNNSCNKLFYTLTVTFFAGKTFVLTHLKLTFGLNS